MTVEFVQVYGKRVKEGTLPENKVLTFRASRGDIENAGSYIFENGDKCNRSPLSKK